MSPLFILFFMNLYLHQKLQVIGYQISDSQCISLNLHIYIKTRLIISLLLAMGYQYFKKGRKKESDRFDNYKSPGKPDRERMQRGLL